MRLFVKDDSIAVVMMTLCGDKAPEAFWVHQSHPDWVLEVEELHPDLRRKLLSFGVAFSDRDVR